MTIFFNTCLDTDITNFLCSSVFSFTENYNSELIWIRILLFNVFKDISVGQNFFFFNIVTIANKILSRCISMQYISQDITDENQ